MWVHSVALLWLHFAARPLLGEDCTMGSLWHCVARRVYIYIAVRRSKGAAENGQGEKEGLRA